MPFLKLGAEAEASIEAANMARKTGGFKKAAKIGSRLIGPYGTYVGSALITGAAYSAIVKKIRNK